MPNLHETRLFTNREISWLEFNHRVLAAARRTDVPLLERLKFAAIAASNLDEFYMVRVAGLERRHRGGYDSRDPSGDRRRPGDVLAEIGHKAKAAGVETAQVLTEVILPAAEKEGIRFLDRSSLDDAQKQELSEYYSREVHPCLTPIAIDPTHPFPHLRNRSLNLALRITPNARAGTKKMYGPREDALFALVQVPSVLPRFVPVKDEKADSAFITLEDVIGLHADRLFPGHIIDEAKPFRVTRAADLVFSEDEADNLLDSIQDGLRRRDRGRALRLEITADTSDELAGLLQDMLDIGAEHVHRHPGFIVTSDLMSIVSKLDRPELKNEPHTPVLLDTLRYDPTLFRTIGERDVLLHHPYESFAHIVDFMNHAADDPNVVAIKQTLYRTSGNSPFVRALARAAANGKQVTALVELKARFDEAANIQWARALEEGGVHVVYGLLGLKTHCKMLLVIRREGKHLRRYLHLGTGNYNSTTARLYTDLSLLTAREDITADAMLLFNVLTGYADLPALQKLVVAPFNLREHSMTLIERETEHARAGRPAHIIAKMNSVVDPAIIRSLYRASQAGVQVDLLVRGICCLRPGIEGVSENIRVYGIIDRFLEHARICWFLNDGDEEVYMSSADWMPRNLNRRIEVTTPVLDPAHKRRIRDEILATELADTAASWQLQPDGTYVPRAEGTAADQTIRSQVAFMQLAEERQARSPRRVRREFAAREFARMPALRVVESKRRRAQRPQG